VGLNLSIYGLLAQFSFSLKAQEAAMKYFILGLLAAGFFLFGI
jgi:NADH:ubiquinone oxidoreductase subunit 2 (subunit N)